MNRVSYCKEYRQGMAKNWDLATKYRHFQDRYLVIEL